MRVYMKMGKGWGDEGFSRDRLAGGERDLAELEAAFERTLREISFAYQPIVRWSSREVFGYEALLRSREATLADPGAVFAAAERLGRLHELGRTIRARVMEPFAAGSSLHVFVNLHARELMDEELFARTAPLSARSGQVVLEITERASLNEVPDVRGRISRLRALGFRIALDDLGAGYAGLTSFALLEPDVVKLDMSLVRNLGREPTKRTLVRTVVAMCEELGTLVVGEGVETAEERDALLELGCDWMQGNLFAAPSLVLATPRWGD